MRCPRDCSSFTISLSGLGANRNWSSCESSEMIGRGVGVADSAFESKLFWRCIGRYSGSDSWFLRRLRKRKAAMAPIITPARMHPMPMPAVAQLLRPWLRGEVCDVATELLAAGLVALAEVLGIGDGWLEVL